MRPVKADVPLRLKSPSSPWPIASCSRIAGPARAEHDRHVAGRRVDGVHVHQRLAHGLARDLERPPSAVSELEIAAPAAACVALLAAAVVLDDY